MRETSPLLGSSSSCRRAARNRRWGVWIAAGLACVGSASILLLFLMSTAGMLPRSGPAEPPASVGRFIHITDLHIDPSYREGSTTYSQCHRQPPHGATADDDGHRRTGVFGIPRVKCDSPPALINATRDHLRLEWGDKTDFVLWTGDSGRHDGDAEMPRTFDEIIEQNRIAANAMRHAFPAHVPIVPNIGNNDVSPHNELPAPGHKRARRTFAQLARAWKDLVPSDQLKTFYYGGYFAKDVMLASRSEKATLGRRGLTALSLNTMYWYRANAKVGGCKANDSPGLAQIAWIRYQIRRARERGHDLILIGHVSPDAENYRPTCYRGYARTVTQLVPPPSLMGADPAANYSAQQQQLPAIHAQLFGHSNVDVWSFIGQDISALAEEDLNNNINTNSGGDARGRLWWEREVDEETGRFGKLIRQVWSADATPSANQSTAVDEDSGLLANDNDDGRILGETLWENMVDDVSGNDVLAPNKALPSDYVDKLIKEFERVLMLKSRHPRLGVTTISPSIIPKFVPSFRVFSYARSPIKGKWWRQQQNQQQELSLSQMLLPSGTLLDYDVYWANIAQHNKQVESGSGVAKSEFFQRLYRFSSEYGLPDLSPDSYLKWARKLVESKKLRKRFRSLAYLEPAY
ncbi:Endopolyphosphatase [Coemansia sp. RSA 2049]|nr:Endopolyphosphatase [Coemansia sp. RSA 2049]